MDSVFISSYFPTTVCLHSFLTAPPTLHWPQRRLNTLCSSELFRQKSCSMNPVYNLFNILDGRMRLVWFMTHPRTIPRWDRYPVFERLLNLVISVMNRFYIICLSLFFFLKISKGLAKSLRNNGTKIVANEGFTQNPAVAVKILKVSLFHSHLRLVMQSSNAWRSPKNICVGGYVFHSSSFFA